MMAGKSLDNELTGEIPREMVFKKYAYDEMSRFRKVELVREFLDTLSEKKKEKLAGWLSAWSGSTIHVDDLEPVLNGFKDMGKVMDFLDSMAFKNMRLLSKWLSKWRLNGMYEIIFNSTPTWKRAMVPVEEIMIRGAGPEYREMIRKNKFSLKNIANDPVLEAHPSFNAWQDMHSNVVLAIKMEKCYRVYDGVHRASRLAMNGAKEIDLIYSEDVHKTMQSDFAKFVNDPDILEDPLPEFSFYDEE
ncbi:MAG: hypothetical protein ACFFCS_10360 [Candidatus Hodarchaeota archaeon]